MIGWTARELLSHLPTLAPEIARATTTVYTPLPGAAERSPEAGGTLSFVTEALKHGGYLEPIEEVAVEVLPSALQRASAPARVRGFCSRVALRNGAVAQLPLLDFRCAVADENADAIVAAMRLLGETRGAILESGRSYHYYGLAPRDGAEWRRFMTHAILLTPLVDVRYLAHCLLESLACLRVDRHQAHPHEPRVVRTL